MNCRRLWTQDFVLQRQRIWRADDRLGYFVSPAENFEDVRALKIGFG